MIIALLIRSVIVGVAATIAVTGVARAQDTRAETIQRARAEKEQAAEPYEPGMLETILKTVERGGVPLITRDRWYLKFGSLTTGSGFAYGGGFRSRRLFDGLGQVDVWGGATMTRYWAAEGRLRFPRLSNDLLDVEAYARRHEYPREDYFGLGPLSLRRNHTNYMFRMTTVGGRAALRPKPIAAIGLGMEHLDTGLAEGEDPQLPSVHDRFTETSAPGLTRQPDFMRTAAYLDIDWRSPLYARNGGWYRAELSRYDDLQGWGFSFDRFDIDVRQYVSFLSERRVLVGRVAASTTTVGSDQQVPFYLMPTLGGNDTLRGFREYRFRGPHALLMQGEYRFEVWSGLDVALFYDTGKVAMRRSELDFQHLESDYGFGFRFNTARGIVARVDAAFGSRDGKHLWIVFGGTF